VPRAWPCGFSQLHDHGFVSIKDLSNLLQENFREVCVFSEAVRHHSQGVRLGERQGRVTEFVLVGKA
jgi:hypothetical protein